MIKAVNRKLGKVSKQLLVGLQQEEMCPVFLCKPGNRKLPNKNMPTFSYRQTVILVFLHFPSTFLNKFLKHIWIWKIYTWGTLKMYIYFRFGLGLCSMPIWGLIGTFGVRWVKFRLTTRWSIEPFYNPSNARGLDQHWSFLPPLTTIVKFSLLIHSENV